MHSAEVVPILAAGQGFAARMSVFLGGLPRLLSSPRSRRADGHEEAVMQPAEAIPLPNGRSTDLCRFVDSALSLRIVGSPFEAVVELCRNVETAYWQEEVIQEFINSRKMDAHLDEWSELDLGIHPRHPLFDIREDVRKRVENQGWATPADVLLLWGATARTGNILFREAGTLIHESELRGLLWQFPEKFSSITMTQVVDEWGRASGVSHVKTVEALHEAAEDLLLNLPPPAMYDSIDAEAVELAASVAPSQPGLAIAFARCLMRIAACTVNGKVRWRSEWLRGQAANADAIPGASTYSAELRELLNDHVFARKVRNHKAGRRATTYLLQRVIRRGGYSDANVASALGVELKGARLDPLPAKVRARMAD
jgi:hypothetical protein